MKIKIVALFLIICVVGAISVSGASEQDKILKCDTSQQIDQGDAAWQQIAIPVNLEGGWRADVIFNHDWSNPKWTISDALDEAQANQVPHYIYSHEKYPKDIAHAYSEGFERTFFGRGASTVSERDTSQQIDQGDAAWQQIAIPVNLEGGWRADVIFNHDWSNPKWTISDALDEAQANQVPYYIYSAELYPAATAIYLSEQFANAWP